MTVDDLSSLTLTGDPLVPLATLGPAMILPMRAQGRIAGVVTVVRGAIEEGFGVPGRALVVLTETDLTGTRGAVTGATRMPSRRRNAVDPRALRSGDFIVHEQHGIGRYLEMIERTVGGAKREYLLIEYAPSKRGKHSQPDRLFVPTDQLDQVSRYVGGESPSLNKLGGADWARTKGRARKAVREIAAELVQLYAARQSAPGHQFGPDTPWQREMEDAFPYEETPDQLQAIADQLGSSVEDFLGATTLLVHGAISDAGEWALVAPHFEGRVVAVDWPRSGLTPPVDIRGMGIRKFALEWLDSVVEAIGAPVRIVGSSAGGYLALLDALARPANVDRVVPLGSFPGPADFA